MHSVWAFWMGDEVLKPVLLRSVIIPVSVEIRRYGDMRYPVKAHLDWMTWMGRFCKSWWWLHNKMFANNWTICLVLPIVDTASMAVATSLLIVLLVGISSCHVISQNNKVQPYLMRLNIDLLTTKLHEKCPQMLIHDDFFGKRDLDKYDQAVDALDFANQVKIYHHIKELLKLCYQQLD